MTELRPIELASWEAQDEITKTLRQRLRDGVDDRVYLDAFMVTSEVLMRTAMEHWGEPKPRKRWVGYDPGRFL